MKEADGIILGSPVYYSSIAGTMKSFLDRAFYVAYGTAPGEVAQDEEGMQIMRVLGKNMAWIMKLVENGKNQVKENEREAKVFTNFIR